MIGDLIAHYRVLELIGRGAMGVVYKALDVNLDRQVAVKVMSAEARNDPDFVERFRQEARMQGALNHPNVAMLFDYFVHDGAPVAVMEFIDGESLEQLIRRRGAIPAHECLPIFRQALRGVAAAHRAGIIHRDLKPSNLMLTKDDIVKVMDFGIAKRQGAPGATKVSSTSIGSPLYMAPEQILGRAVDCRTDVYALGLTLYELLSGHRPFNPRGKAEFQVLNAHVNELPEPPTVYRYGIPRPIVDAVMRSLAKDPDARFQSADDFMHSLADVPAPNAATPRPDPSGTVALEYSPPVSEDVVEIGEPTGTTVFEYAPSPATAAAPAVTVRIAAPPVVTVKIAPPAAQAAATPSHTSAASAAVPSPAAQRPRGPPPGLLQRLRAHRLGLAAALVVTLVLGLLMRNAERQHATPWGASLASGSRGQAPVQTSAPAQTPPAEQPSGPPLADATSAAGAAAAPPAQPGAATAAPAAAAPLDATSPPSRPDLSGTWRGEYLDASGRQLLRVVNLSISRVYEDGGIEGTLQYAAASGDGECRLDPRGSAYSADVRRLQLSPEGCSPHYPKVLSVPLDFDAVNPRANTLKNGRIEAPTGEVVRVRLKRVSGV
jgi:eukaryotic-like serine/threonine-protein kinase